MFRKAYIYRVNLSESRGVLSTSIKWRIGLSLLTLPEKSFIMKLGISLLTKMGTLWVNVMQRKYGMGIGYLFRINQSQCSYI